ncbi:hypothetical protein HY995_03700 [Candidatus Micrarchaeota archaeon]|nr:hypothetical protein [Candidatus Micrarchaeota archaeon]
MASTADIWNSFGEDGWVFFLFISAALAVYLGLIPSYGSGLLIQTLGNIVSIPLQLAEMALGANLLLGIAVVILALLFLLNGVGGYFGFGFLIACLFGYWVLTIGA